jgi:hypothetical protein
MDHRDDEFHRPSIGGETRPTEENSTIR